MTTTKNEASIGLYRENYCLLRGNEPLVRVKIWWVESEPNAEYYGSA